MLVIQELLERISRSLRERCFNLLRVLLDVDTGRRREVVHLTAGLREERDYDLFAGDDAGREIGRAETEEGIARLFQLADDRDGGILTRGSVAQLERERVEAVAQLVQSKQQAAPGANGSGVAVTEAGTRARVGSAARAAQTASSES